jgi:TOM7 family
MDLAMYISGVSYYLHPIEDVRYNIENIPSRNIIEFQEDLPVLHSAMSRARHRDLYHVAVARSGRRQFPTLPPSSCIMAPKSFKQEALSTLNTAVDYSGTFARVAFHWGYVPLILWLGSRTTEDGILNALFPPV